MRLERLSSSFMHSHQADSRDYSKRSIYKTPDEDGMCYVDFRSFGAGSERFSDFIVSLDWEDVEAIIQTFTDMGNIEAIRIKRARRLAAAMEEFAKNSN